MIVIGNRPTCCRYDWNEIELLWLVFGFLYDCVWMKMKLN